MTIDLHRKCNRYISKSRDNVRENDVPCGEEMDLIMDGSRMLWLCRKCYPNYPNRSLPYPLCPNCGKEMKETGMHDYKCKTCNKSYTARPMILTCASEQPGYIDDYHEFNEWDVYYWESSSRRVDKYQSLPDGWKNVTPVHIADVSKLSGYNRKDYVDVRCIKNCGDVTNCCGCVMSPEDLLYPKINPAPVQVKDATVNKPRSANEVWTVCGAVWFSGMETSKPEVVQSCGSGGCNVICKDCGRALTNMNDHYECFVRMQSTIQVLETCGKGCNATGVVLESCMEAYGKLNPVYQPYVIGRS